MTPDSGEFLNIDVHQISSELRIRPEIYVKIVSSFSLTLGDKIKVLGEAIEKKDLESLRRTLHEIKGTASNLRLKPITEIEDRMHNEVKGDANQDVLRRNLVELTRQTDLLQAKITQLKIL